MDPIEINRLRLHNQRLAGSPFQRPEEVVRWLGAVQSQDFAGAKWGLAQRSPGLTDREIDQAFNEGRILRTHLMRPTWHFVDPSDIRWLLALTSPRVHAVNAYYYRQLEIDETVIRRSRKLIEDELQGGRQRTRAELAGALEAVGVPSRGQRLAYLIMHAELEAVICSGARRGRQFTYALLEERVPPSAPLDRDEALAELVRRYFTSHGPATLRDFAWWSGLTVAEAKTGMESVQSRFEQMDVEGKTYWFSPIEKPIELHSPVIHLLPNYDEDLIAYKDRYSILDPAVPPDLNLQEGALIANLLVRDGLVIGGWRRDLGKKQVSIETQPLVDLNEGDWMALKESARQFGRFLGLAVVLDGERI